MPSILPEYEYDIFISYRQNDNKRDGWVSSFVQALRDELEATLKNPVSIYFDENPHDGLLETHQVEASLQGKLKCIVFIPIISQTYCDEKGFAWSQEFLPFLEMVKSDELGLNIKLTNGNVVSRVLPIRIHDLDNEDQTLLDETLQGPLRAIDFIYKEPGVNRPLMPLDKRELNQEKTSYQNQLNKVANALKDIGTSVLRSNVVSTEEDRVATDTLEVTSVKRYSKIIIAIALIAVIALSYWGFTNYSNDENKVSTVANTENSHKVIAVLPFSNTKPDPNNDYLGFAMASQVIGALDYNKDLTVRPSSAIRKYDQQVIDTKQVADDLRVSYVLTGTYLMQDDIIRLNIELLEANSDQLIWRDNIEVDFRNAFDLQDIVAKKVVDGLQVQFTQTELSRINKDISHNSLAFEYYLRAISYPITKEGGALAIEMLNKSIELDSTFAPAYAELGNRFHELAIYENLDPLLFIKVEELYLKAISINENLLSALNNLSMFYTETKRIEEAVFLTRKVLSLNPNNAEAHFNLSYIYRYAGMDQEGIIEGEKALTLDPGNPRFRSLSLSYYNIQEYSKAQNILDIVEPSDWVEGMRGFLYFTEGKEVQALEVFDKIIAKNPENFWGLIAVTNKAIIEGDKALGLEIMQKREQSNMIDGEPLFYDAITYSLLEDKDGCNRLLQKAVNAGYFNYPAMLSNPDFEFMKDDPEFQSILQQAKLKHEAFKEKFFND
jgi:TolB-like protein